MNTSSTSSLPHDDISPNVTSANKISFVCCVESGGLESQTVRLIESLRRFGGRYANCDVIAVTPRFGPALSNDTIQFFRKYSIEYIRPEPHKRYAWFNYYNKPLALVEAEKHLQTEAIAFLDSDLLITQEPDCIELAKNEDLLAFPVEVKEMGTRGEGDPYETFWEACCKFVGIDIQDMPWVTTAQTQDRIRLYFNSGIFVYRVDSGFAKEYLKHCTTLLDSKVGTNAPGYGLGFKEQVSVAYAAITLGLKWRSLPYTHNYPMSKLTHADWYSPEALTRARIVHYHDAMWPPFWTTFQSCMQEAHPNVAQWLSSLGPMENRASVPNKVLARFLYQLRKRRSNQYLASCSIY